jgi:predicted  nucleic acid-binding Zn-ribbon protein
MNIANTSPPAIARTPEELLESMKGMFLPPSAMGEVNGLKVLCLQRENTALKAEVERLTKKLSITEDELADAREWLNERYKATSESDERAEKAEAEVERLKANLRRAVEIAEDFLPSGYDGYDETIRTELDQIKATLNPTEK